MATQASGMIQDQNLNIHYSGASVGGKVNTFKAQKKGNLGGRKALADISGTPNQSSKNLNFNNFSVVDGKKGNLGGRRKALADISGTPNQSSKNPNFKNFGIVDGKISTSKSTYYVGGEKSVSKAKEKVQTSGRKPLSDISNSRKPCVHQASKKNHEKILNAVSEEEIHPDAIAEEQFLHNHQECIKGQKKAIDINYLLKMVALDEDFSMPLASPLESPISRKVKPESPLKYLEMEEMAELPIENQLPRCRKSPPPCQSPNSPSSYMHNWEDQKLPSFTLIETPVLPKQ